MLEEPRIVQTDEQLTAVILLAVSRAEIGRVMGPAVGELNLRFRNELRSEQWRTELNWPLA